MQYLDRIDNTTLLIATNPGEHPPQELFDLARDRAAHFSNTDNPDVQQVLMASSSWDDNFDWVLYNLPADLPIECPNDVFSEGERVMHGGFVKREDGKFTSHT